MSARNLPWAETFNRPSMLRTLLPVSMAVELATARRIAALLGGLRVRFVAVFTARIIALSET